MSENNGGVQFARRTYKNYDLSTFKKDKEDFEKFRRNAHGHNMEAVWKSLKDMYLPDTTGSHFFAKYTSDSSTGTATPDTLYSNESEDTLSFEEPLVAVKVHTALSLLTARTPDVKWDSDDERYEKAVPLINALRHADWQDEQVKEQYVMLWFYDILYGTTYAHRFYELSENEVYLPKSLNLADDSVEYAKTNKIEFDGTTMEALSPWAVWPDPASEPLKPRSQRKVMYEKTYTFDQLVKRFKDAHSEAWFEENITPTVVDDSTGSDMVKCRFVEDKDLDLLYVVANDNTEILKSHLPQNHKELSILSAIWMPRDEKAPFGVGPIEMLSEDKRALDEFKSMTLTQVKFSIYRAIFYTGTLQSDGGESGGITIRPDRAYKVSEKPFIFEIPGPGNDSWEAIKQLRERVDDASGINRPLGGEIVKTTAFQTDLAKDAALARLSTPISFMTLLLAQDAKLTYELQLQHYALPRVEEIVDPDVITRLQESLDRLRAEGKEPNFDLWVDAEAKDEEGNLMPRVYKGTYREAQLNVEKTSNGQYLPAPTKNTTVLTAEKMAWKGKIYIVTDSILSISPTIEKQRKLEMYNLLIPMFTQPPQFVAKPAYSIVKLYGDDPEDVLPKAFIDYLKAEKSGQLPAEPQPGMPGMGGQPAMPGAPGPGGAAPVPGAPAVDPRGAMKFEQPGAPVVSTGFNGQKDVISAQSASRNR